MKKKSSDDINKILSHLSHELKQSLMVINTYALGGVRRLEKDNCTSLQLLTVLKKIIEHVELIENKLDETRHFFQEEV